MKASDIPFAKYVGINENNEILSLEFKDNLLNHVKTIHASAQFTLAETDSGIYLQKLFPEFKGKVVPLLREAKIKYKKPALEQITAHSSVSKEEIEKFKNIFDKKKRGVITVTVDIKDINQVTTSQATFTWFVQAI
jgi:acyl-coenzyme A thioesterase PaaI-like protein